MKVQQARPWQPWGSVHVLASLLASCRGLTDAATIASYFYRRSRDAAQDETSVRLKGLEAPLRLSASTGGLATFYEIAVRRIYAPWKEFEPQAADVVVDVGANIGVYSLWAAARVGEGGTILSIEPHPDAYRQMSASMEAAKCRHLARRAACGDHQGELTLHVTPGRLSVASAIPRDSAKDEISVPLSTLDTILAEEGIGNIDVLKIDVEGYEPEVLRGAHEALHRTHRLVVEVSAHQLGSVITICEQHGLPLVAVRSGMWGLPWATVAAFERPATH